MEPSFYPNLQETLDSLSIDQVPGARIARLQLLIEAINSQITQNRPVRLNFICTHNSRRSMFGQCWAQAIAAHMGIEVDTYSGGSESTAFFPAAAAALQAGGFQVTKIQEGTNPVYAVKYAPDSQPLVCFSKTFDHFFNPTSGMIAVMVCLDADQNCPYIPAAAHRISLPYEDPKVSDDRPDQVAVYAERSLQIATELTYVFSHIKSGN
ncbi:MAG: protein-tyrosine-phosphatase [Bacteroidota bacterium]